LIDIFEPFYFIFFFVYLSKVLFLFGLEGFVRLFLLGKLFFQVLYQRMIIFSWLLGRLIDFGVLEKRLRWDFIVSCVGMIVDRSVGSVVSWRHVLVGGLPTVGLKIDGIGRVAMLVVVSLKSRLQFGPEIILVSICNKQSLRWGALKDLPISQVTIVVHIIWIPLQHFIKVPDINQLRVPVFPHHSWIILQRRFLGYWWSIILLIVVPHRITFWEWT
jgi:hypothetical protein